MPFPDTPIDVTFALDAESDTVTVTLSYKTLPAPRRATAPRAELVRWICELARGVFEKLYALVPDARFQRVLDPRKFDGGGQVLQGAARETNPM